jgi:uncharacterized protein (TIRG00374 family)
MQLPGAADQVVANRSIEDWIGTGTILLALFVGALYLVVVFPGRMIGLYEMFARRVAPSIEARGRDILLAFASGLSILRSPRRFAVVFVWTALHWLLNAFAFWCGFRAVAIEISPFAALVVQGFVAILVAVPSTPGYAGVFEFASVTALDLYGVDATEALAWALGYHVLTFIPLTLIGLVYFSRLHLHFRDVGRVAATPDPDAALVATQGRAAPPRAAPERPAGGPGAGERASDASPP